MKKYQVAIIGTNIGAKHFEDFQKVSDRFSVHTLCGLTRDAIDKILASNNDTKMSLNFDDVLKVKEIDIIDICLPPHLHFSACKKSLEAGKHVICEKLPGINWILFKTSPFTKSNPGYVFFAFLTMA